MRISEHTLEIFNRLKPMMPGRKKEIYERWFLMIRQYVAHVRLGDIPITPAGEGITTYFGVSYDEWCQVTDEFERALDELRSVKIEPDFGPFGNLLEQLD